MAAEAGVPLRWQPFLLGPVFGAQGWDTSPFKIYPAKGRYMWRDMERIAQARGLPFRRPEGGDFPARSLGAARLALVALDHDAGAAFCRAVFAAQFESCEDIADPATLAACLDRAGLPANLMEEASAPANRPALRAATERALALDIFGAPTFEVDGELFWGDDRLESALDWARTAQGAP